MKFSYSSATSLLVVLLNYYTKMTPPHLLDADYYRRTYVNKGSFMHCATYQRRTFQFFPIGLFSLPIFFLWPLQIRRVTAHFENRSTSKSCRQTLFQNQQGKKTPKKLHFHSRCPLNSKITLFDNVVSYWSDSFD